MDDYLESKIIMVQNIVLLKFLTTFDLLSLWGSKYRVKKDCSKD